MAAMQMSCADCRVMADSKTLFIVARPVEGTSLLGDISTGPFRPLVPAAFRDAAVAAVHNVAHPGVEATVRLTSSKFCWPGMRRQCRQFAQQCLACQRGKIARHVHLKPAAIAVPGRRFEHIHVDLVGPLPTSAAVSYTHLTLPTTPYV